MKLKYYTIAVLLMIITVAVLPSAVVADSASAPQLPAQIYGTVVDKDGVPLPVGTVITATVDGKEFTYTITEPGKIGEPGTFGEKFLVHGENAGSTIVFSVNGETAGELTSYTPGKSMEFSLSFPVDADSLQTSDNPTVTPTPISTQPSVNPTEVKPAPSETQGTYSHPTLLPTEGKDAETLPTTSDTGDSPAEVVPTVDISLHPADVQTPGFSFGLLMGALTLGVFLGRKEE